MYHATNLVHISIMYPRDQYYLSYMCGTWGLRGKKEGHIKYFYSKHTIFLALSPIICQVLDANCHSSLQIHYDDRESLEVVLQLPTPSKNITTTQRYHMMIWDKDIHLRHWTFEKPLLCTGCKSQWFKIVEILDFLITTVIPVFTSFHTMLHLGYISHIVLTIFR